MKNKGLVICFVLVLILLIGVVGYNDTHYTKKGVIGSVVADRVTVEDETGNVWVFYGEGFKRGDSVKIVFNNEHTPIEREDDSVVKVVKR